jgi:hypothetical protein
MSHIAIQEALDGKVVDWLEKVSDAEYLAGASLVSWSWNPYHPRRRPNRRSPPVPAARGPVVRRARPRPAYQA